MMVRMGIDKGPANASKTKDWHCGEHGPTRESVKSAIRCMDYVKRFAFRVPIARWRGQAVVEERKPRRGKRK